MTENVNGFGHGLYNQDELSMTTFVMQQMLNGLATAIPVKVKSVSAEAIDAQPMVHQIDGKGTATPHETIHGMPFFTHRAGNSAVTLKPKVGDIGIAIFCHSDISSVKSSKKPSTPGSRRRFDWSDGIYFGGILGGTPTQYITLDDDDGIEIKAASGKTIKLIGDVEFSGGTVKHDGVNIGKDHTHSGVTGGAGASGPPT